MTYLKMAIATALASTLSSALWASPATEFDGAYRGQRTVLRGDEPACIKPGTTTLSVKDGVFKVTYARNTFDARVEADGSFERTKLFNAGRTTVSATLKGRITNRTLEADLETYACKYHYVLTRR